MKTFILSLFLLSFMWTNAQHDLRSYLKQRAENNLQILAKSPLIKERVQIANDGIHLLDENKRKELSFNWSEIGKVVDILETKSYYEMLKYFRNKKTQTFQDAHLFTYDINHYKTYPTSFKDLYVAIDPGHFGGSNETATLEQRIVKIAAKDVGTKYDIILKEADLAYCTALFLKEMLTEAGATVLITRPYGNSAIGEDFTSWLNNGGFIRDLSNMLQYGDITQEYYNNLKTCHQQPSLPANKLKLFDFYKFVDFRARINKINSFAPNLTISIHYNASDNNTFYGDRYLVPVSENYNMAFVPGAFLHNELNQLHEKLDFVRLLLSPDIENSITLAKLIMDEHEKLLNVPKRTNIDNSKLNNVCLYINDAPGVYARNLAITRMVRGPVVYGESLIQDNAEEAIKLFKKDDTAYDPVEGPIPAPSRTRTVAQAYFNAIKKYLETNQPKEKQYEILKATVK